MTYFSIPINTAFPWYVTTIALSGVSYTLTFRYNNRSQRWIMDIADGAGNNILNGLVLLIENDLTYQYQTALSNLPVGNFFVVDETGQDTQPTQFSFGTTHELIYADPTQ